MKTIFNIIFVLSFFISPAEAQTPDNLQQRISVRGDDGELMLNKYARVRFILFDEKGDILFEEVHTGMTDSLGFITLVVGNGNPVTGAVSDIDRDLQIKLLDTKVVTDPDQYTGNDIVLSIMTNATGTTYKNFKGKD